MRLRPEAVRIVPTACGGGFGGKLDLSVQPLDGASRRGSSGGRWPWSTRGRKSMAASTKRHPARMAAKFGCDAEGKLFACDVTAMLRHRRLCLVGADRGQPRAGARHGALPRRPTCAPGADA